MLRNARYATQQILLLCCSSQAKAPGTWSMGSLDEGDDVSVRSAERASAVNSHGVLRLAEHDLSGGRRHDAHAPG